MSSTQEKLGSILDTNDSKMASFSAIIWHKGEGRAAKREWQKRRQETIDDLTTLIDSAKREGAIEANQKWKQYLLDYHEHHDHSVDPTESPYVDSLEMESDIDKDTARLKQSMGKSYVDETIYPVDAKKTEKWYDGKKKPKIIGDDAVWGAE